MSLDAFVVKIQKMERVAQVRIRKLDRIAYFLVGNLNLKISDYCIIESEAEKEDYGEVISSPKFLELKDIDSPLRKILRKVNEEDIEKIENNYKRDEEAFEIALKKIEETAVPMKLIDAEHSFDLSIITFYYWAEERVDFGELVKTLASIFNCRIEMRQIGLRDEARMVGGHGICGRPICCALFLKKFKPVTMRMAKKQNLPSDTSKISGLCGRLRCCLAFEGENYGEKNK